MHFRSLIASSLFASSVLARSGRSPLHVRKDVPEFNKRTPLEHTSGASPHLQKRGKPNYGGPAKDGYIIEQTEQTKKFSVDGTALPFVDFDIGESYAGLLPISNESDVSELYFWFFPSDNADATDEILIWLNGGPGCSSLEGWLQENGPAIWQYGTYRPVQNPYTWINLTNVVWIEQPAGTGFSPKKSTPSATNENEVAAQFLGFWKNFVDTFGLHNRKVYITGESYAGF
jgi:carboxypeptidase D